MIFSTFKYYIIYYYNKAFDIRIIYKWTDLISRSMNEWYRSVLEKREKKTGILNNLMKVFTAKYDKINQ